MLPPTFDPQLWTDEENEIWKSQGYHCIVCEHWGDTLHEITPKSKAPKVWRDPENRVVVCNWCHIQIHKTGAKVWKTRLEILREKAIRKYGDKNANN